MKLHARCKATLRKIHVKPKRNVAANAAVHPDQITALSRSTKLALSGVQPLSKVSWPFTLLGLQGTAGTELSSAFTKNTTQEHAAHWV